MQRKSEIEWERYRVQKIARNLIRLKHSLAADKEIFDFLPDTLDEFDRGLQKGNLLGPSELLQSILED